MNTGGANQLFLLTVTDAWLQEQGGAVSGALSSHPHHRRSGSLPKLEEKEPKNVQARTPAPQTHVRTLAPHSRPVREAHPEALGILVRFEDSLTKMLGTRIVPHLGLF
jgi:hypothetical protein